MTTLDGAFYLAESEPPFISQMWEAIQTAEPLEGALSPWSMRQIVATVYDGLMHLKALGRTPAQICEFLTEYSGLGITPSTLATYLSREKHQRQGQKRSSSVSPALAVPTDIEPIQEQSKPVESAGSVEPSSVQAVEASSAPETGNQFSHPSTATAVDPVAMPEAVTPVKAQLLNDKPHPSSVLSALPADEAIASVEPSSQPQPRKAKSAKSKSWQKSWRSDEPDNPPAPESLLDEPTFNTIERD